MMVRWLFLAAMLLFIAPEAVAQAPVQPPASSTGLSQEQFDSLVDAVSKAVVKQLREAGVATPDRSNASPAHAANPSVPLGSDRDEAELIQFFARAKVDILSLPVLWAQLGRIPNLLQSEPGARSLGLYFAMLALAVAVALGVEAAIRRVTFGLRRHFAIRIEGWAGLGALATLAVLDGFGLLAIWIASYGLLVAWFPGAEAQSRLASLILVSVFSWRLYMFAFRVALRPAIPEARLAKISDRDAKAIYATVAGVIIIVLALRVILRILIAIGAPTEAISLARSIGAVVIVASMIVAAMARREEVGRWFHGLLRQPEAHPVREALARHWLVLAIPFFLLLGLTQIYGAIAAQFEVPAALLLTLNIAIGLLIFESLIDKFDELFASKNDAIGGRSQPRLWQAVSRCFRAAIFIGAAVLVAEAWMFDVLGLTRGGDLNGIASKVLTLGATILVAYCAWEGARLLTDHYVADEQKHGPPGLGEEAHPAAISRLATLMPLLRVALMVVICLLATLTVLSQFGVNITALLAGASIVGLALSFGSQTLVKDIISGIFYLADDAFRVGEYIDCGKAKGTVEGFTMRSLRLRHQNGPVHTIPFGQLGQITNFSRDWTTVKFNLRFPLDTDIEQLRKTVKKIGLEMLDDPEIKNEILEPLKMQGVADIAENALDVRFKFTVKPSNPTFVQRDAMKRMFRALPEAGIKFASAMVAVQTIGASVGETAAAAAVGRIKKPQVVAGAGAEGAA